MEQPISDTKGVPVNTQDGMVFSLPRKIRWLAQCPRGFMFYDEMPWAPPTVQATALRLIAEGKLEDTDLSHISFVAAGNDYGLFRHRVRAFVRAVSL